MPKPLTAKSELTDKQEQFCQEYLIDLNGSKAAERAGFSEKSARHQAYQMIRKPHIQARITELQEKRAIKTGVSAEKVIARLDQIGGVDIAECFTEEGAFKNIHAIPKPLRECIQSIDVFEEFEMVNGKRVKIGETKRIKFCDKIKSNELIGRNLKMWTDKIDHTHRAGTLEDLVAGSSPPPEPKKIK